MSGTTRQPASPTGGRAPARWRVPVGPALRVHRFRKADPVKKRTAIVEEIAWVICPPKSSQAVMMSTKWGEPAFSPAAITIADDMAENIRIESAN
jgi:hypothetical protein